MTDDEKRPPRKTRRARRPAQRASGRARHARRPASTSAAPTEAIHEESDAKAPIKGADPQGESEPDAETKAESLTAPAPEVSSAATEAAEDKPRP